MLINQLQIQSAHFFGQLLSVWWSSLGSIRPPKKIRQYRSVASHGATIGGTKFRSGNFRFPVAVSSRNPETEWTLSHGYIEKIWNIFSHKKCKLHTEDWGAIWSSYFDICPAVVRQAARRGRSCQGERMTCFFPSSGVKKPVSWILIKWFMMIDSYLGVLIYILYIFIYMFFLKAKSGGAFNKQAYRPESLTLTASLRRCCCRSADFNSDGQMGTHQRCPEHPWPLL